jgi:hypothetical protein
MTTLVSWVSYMPGPKGTAPNALYLVSDSRITWGSSARHWDAGRKVFTCRIEPHMFGYCGDVVFPSLVLAQIISAIDNGLLFADDADAEQKHTIVFESIQRSFRRRHDTPDQNFWILHALRTGDGPGRIYSVWQIFYNAKTRTWDTVSLPIPPKTAIVAILGTGTASVKKHVSLWTRSDVGGRSSAIFSAFCDALFSKEDLHSGGAPQIAALHPGSHAQIIGFIQDDIHYLHGLEMIPGKMLHRIKWRDRHFQNINPSTRRRGANDRRLKRPFGL